MANDIATAYVRIVPTATGIKKGLEETLGESGKSAGQKSGQNFASSFSAATGRAAAALAPVSQAAQGFLGDVVSTAADFDAQMSKVQAISGAYGQDLADIRNLALEMGRTTKFSASESAQALEYMGMAGWKSDQMIAGLPGILNLAAAAGEDLGTTSDIVTDALTAFGLGAEDAGRMADIMASAATNSNTNVAMMGETFKYAAGLSGSLKFSMEDVAIAMGLMANSGTKSSQAGTSLRNIMQRLAKPTKESATAMEALGIKIDDGKGNMLSFREIMNQMRSSLGNLKYDQGAYTRGVEELNKQLEGGVITQEEYDEALEDLADITLKSADAQKAQYAAMLSGSWGLSGLMAIVNASEEDYQKLCDAVDQSSDVMVRTTEGAVMPLSQALAEGVEYTEQFNGTAEAMSSIMQDNLNGKVTEMKSRFEGLKIELGEKLMPILERIVDWISGAIDWFSSLDEGTQNLILTAMGVVAIGTPILNLISGVSGGIGSIVKGISHLVGKGLPSLGQGLGNVGGPASAATTALQGVATAALGAFDAMMIFYDVSKLSEAAAGYEGALNAHQNETQTILDNYAKSYDAAGKEAADSWAGALYDIDLSNMTFEQSQAALAEAIEKKWEGVPQNMWEGFAAGWNDYFGSGDVLGGVWRLLDDAGNGIIDFFSGIFKIGSPSKVFEDIGGNLVAGLNIGLSDTSETINTLSDTATDMVSAISNQDGNMQIVGANLMVGLANGIYAGQSYAITAAQHVADAVTRTIRYATDTHSPSRVFAEIGRDLIDGLDQGMASRTNAVIQRARTISGDISSASVVPIQRQNASAQQASRDLTVILELDRTQFGRAVYKMNNEETQRVGVRLSGGFA